MQPRSRLEDLVRIVGVKEGVISVPQSGGTAVKVMNPKGKSASGSSSGKSPLGPGRLNGVSNPASSSSSSHAGSSSLRAAAATRSTKSIPFSSLAVSFSTRKVGLVLTMKDRKKTIVEVERTRDEKLEIAARLLVFELKEWIQAMG